MNITDAAHKTVHSYPGGSEALAPRIGMSAAVLRNKVNPQNSTHHLTLAEADLILGVQADHSMLHALAGNHGYTLQRIGGGENGSVFAAMLAASAAKGDLASALAAALSDGELTPNEIKNVNALCAAVQAAMVNLAAIARGVGERGGSVHA